MFKSFLKGGCPKYCVKRLTLKEMTETCIGKKVDQDLVCKNVPYAKQSNAVYVIDINCVSLNGLSLDGFIYNKHSCPTQSVEVVYHHDNLVASKVVVPKRTKLKIFIRCAVNIAMLQQFSMPDPELKRTITHFE